MKFSPGERLHCPNRISRGNGTAACWYPIEILLPPETRATGRVAAIPRYYPGEAQVECKRRGCRAQLAIRLDGVA